jgi:hypothetical protein
VQARVKARQLGTRYRTPMLSAMGQLRQHFLLLLLPADDGDEVLLLTQLMSFEQPVAVEVQYRRKGWRSHRALPLGRHADHAR